MEIVVAREHIVFNAYRAGTIEGRIERHHNIDVRRFARL
jgi:hypothetical protein